jgi:hypothetical protein
MFNIRHNFHHSRIPAIGTIAKPPKELCNRYNGINTKDKLLVTHYPLSNNTTVYGFGYGFHTVFVKSLRTNRTIEISGFWLMDEE